MPCGAAAASFASSHMERVQGWRGGCSPLGAFGREAGGRARQPAHIGVQTPAAELVCLPVWLYSLFDCNRICDTDRRAATPLAVEPDEPHIAAAKEANRALKMALYSTGLRSPFL